MAKWRKYIKEFNITEPLIPHRAPVWKGPSFADVDLPEIDEEELTPLPSLEDFMKENNFEDIGEEEPEEDPEVLEILRKYGGLGIDDAWSLGPFLFLSLRSGLAFTNLLTFLFLSSGFDSRGGPFSCYDGLSCFIPISFNSSSSMLHDGSWFFSCCVVSFLLTSSVSHSSLHYLHYFYTNCVRGLCLLYGCYMIMFIAELQYDFKKGFIYFRGGVMASGRYIFDWVFISVMVFFLFLCFPSKGEVASVVLGRFLPLWVLFS